MKLTNFRLENEPCPRGIEVDGNVLDLHNSFCFEELHQDIAERTVTMLWRPSGYGASPLPKYGFELVFSDVVYFEVTPRDQEIPDFGEDFCLGGVDPVPHDDDTFELLAHGVPYPPNFPDENFHLWFCFRSGQHVRIGAGSAEFRSLPTK